MCYFHAYLYYMVHFQYAQRKEKRGRDGDRMGLNSFLKSPKKEEQEVPDTINTVINGNYGDEKVNTMDDLECILGISEDEEKLTKTNLGQLNWDFTNWDHEFRNRDDDDNDEEEVDNERELKLFDKEMTECCFEEEGCTNNNNNMGIVNVKREHVTGFWDDDYKRVSLNLNLNYQEVLDAWSDRGSLWADDCSLSVATNGCYMGEVPVMEEEKTRREASVMRYKEKRQTRLFSKKIRYQVRKLNADKRPRFKGRFVKRVSCREKEDIISKG